MKPYYQDERAGITIYLGDCREVLPTLEPGSADLLLTDPPYGVGKAEWDGEFPTFWIAEAWRIAPRILLMPGNSALIEAASQVGDYRDCIVLYAKNGMTLSKIAFGNWIPVLACGDWKWEARPNVLPFIVNTEERIQHPSPKPLSAIRALMTKYSKPEWAILDPFMGSGTTLRAAKDLGRRAIGIEISEEYCRIAVKRLQQECLPLRVEQVEQRERGRQLPMLGSMAPTAEGDQVGVKVGILDPVEVSDRK